MVPTSEGASLGSKVTFDPSVPVLPGSITRVLVRKGAETEQVRVSRDRKSTLFRTGTSLIGGRGGAVSNHSASVTPVSSGASRPPSNPAGGVPSTVRTPLRIPLRGHLASALPCRRRLRTLNPVSTRGRISVTKVALRSSRSAPPPPPHASVRNAGVIGRGFASESITAALPPKAGRSLEVISEVQPDQSAAEMEGGTFMKSF